MRKEPSQILLRYVLNGVLNCEDAEWVYLTVLVYEHSWESLACIRTQ